METDVKKIVVIDYGSGNLRSVAKALQVVIDKNKLAFEVLVTDRPGDIRNASHIILPGQGAFADCMAGLRNIEGMIDALKQSVVVNGVPFLGICVGMQLLASMGLEHGEHRGLDWIEGTVVPIEPEDKNLKIPHMGWNNVSFSSDCDHPVLKNQKNDAYFYFVHSFMFKCKDRDNVLAVSEYGGEVTAVVSKANIIGVQFHPEKSQDAGLQLLHDFLNWTG